MAVARRAYLYVMAFAGLMAVLYAAAGMLALIVSWLTLRSSTLLGAGDLRERASLYLAALVVGLPIWLGHWLLAQRLVERAPEERAAFERRLFLAAVFAVTSVVTLFALHRLLATLLTLPGPRSGERAALDGIAAGARLLVYGAAWYAYARFDRQRATDEAATAQAGQAERRERDGAHDLAVYILAGFALAFLASGAEGTIRQLLRELLLPERPAVLAGPPGSQWAIWGALAARVVAGAAFWVPVWQYDLARGGRRDLRVGYLYLVLLVAVPATLGSVTYGLSETLRRLFGYRPPLPSPAGLWDYLPGAISVAVVGGAVWAYHWSVLRRQAALAPAGMAAPSATPPGGIPWPRRPALALLTLFGLASAAPALVSLLWVGLDALLNTGGSLGGGAWWRDRLSFSLAAALVGTATWLGSWTVLQRAAAADPARERVADARRYLLGAVTIVAALFTLGFLIAMLWLVFRALLGDPLRASGVSWLLKEFSGAVVASAIAGYHGLTLRRDSRLAGPQRARVPVTALVAPGADALLDELREASGLRIDVAGRLSDRDVASGPGLDLPALREQLAALGADGGDDRALLVLRPDGGALYRYRR